MRDDQLSIPGTEPTVVATSADDYAPFPEQALIALAEHFENIGNAWNKLTPTGAKLRDECMGRAKCCRDAVTAHTALRERALLAEHNNRYGPPTTVDDDVDDGGWIADRVAERDDEPPNPFD